MKLQKLLYLLYARILSKTNFSIFPDRFEKWEYGPVLSNIYTEFKKYKGSPITWFACDSDGEVRIVSESDDRFKEYFYDVWSRFGNYNGIYLSQLTHRDGSAWSKAEALGDFLKEEDVKIDGQTLFGC
jgi:uncharacterized phage-associated protein